MFRKQALIKALASWGVAIARSWRACAFEVRRSSAAGGDRGSRVIEESIRDTSLGVIRENKTGDVARVLNVGDSVWAGVVSAARM
jgi:hypothetical protein